MTGFVIAHKKVVKVVPPDTILIAGQIQRPPIKSALCQDLLTKRKRPLHSISDQGATQLVISLFFVNLTETETA